eukprot:349724-Chlamydomonas_euryale.AAC.1
MGGCQGQPTPLGASSESPAMSMQEIIPVARHSSGAQVARPLARKTPGSCLQGTCIGRLSSAARGWMLAAKHPAAIGWLLAAKPAAARGWLLSGQLACAKGCLRAAKPESARGWLLAAEPHAESAGQHSN